MVRLPDFSGPSLPQPTLWDMEEKWPFDAPDYVFLFRACRLLWGDEPSSSEDECKQLLLKVREHFAWRRLVGALQMTDGSFRPLGADWWNTGHYRSWFRNGTVRLRDIVPSASFDANSPMWLFVARSGLEALLGGEADQAKKGNAIEVSKQFVDQRPAPHRPNGVNLKAADAEPVRRMGDLIIAGNATGPFDAASQILRSDPSLIKGSGTPASKVRRLTNRYKDNLRGE